MYNHQESTKCSSEVDTDQVPLVTGALRLKASIFSFITCKPHKCRSKGPRGLRWSADARLLKL